MGKIISCFLKLFKSDNKYDSRKYKITLLIFLTTSLICVLPPCLSIFLFKSTAPIIILSGAEYVTILTTLMGIYFSANVYEKKIIQQEPLDKEKNKTTINKATIEQTK